MLGSMSPMSLFPSHREPSGTVHSSTSHLVYRNPNDSSMSIDPVSKSRPLEMKIPMEYAGKA